MAWPLHKSDADMWVVKDLCRNNAALFCQLQTKRSVIISSIITELLGFFFIPCMWKFGIKMICFPLIKIQNVYIIYTEHLTDKYSCFKGKFSLIKMLHF